MSLIAPMIAGSVSGLVATAPMTLAMAVLHGRSPWNARDPLPPREITEELAERTGLAESMDEREVRAVTTANHFAYGAATGSLYGVLADRVAVPRVVSGLLFALSVWTISYMGWLPALRIMPPATQQPADRNAVMIAAHVVWGISMGLVLSAIRRDRNA
ncbi:MAG: DUF1440 domain-containing protein [Dehalococcoidia bacterium]